MSTSLCFGDMRWVVEMTANVRLTGLLEKALITDCFFPYFAHNRIVILHVQWLKNVLLRLSTFILLASTMGLGALKIR